MLIQLIDFLGTIATTRYVTHVAAISIALLALRLWANGRENTRDRDMHGRVVVLTVCPNALLLCLISNLSFFLGRFHFYRIASIDGAGGPRGTDYCTDAVTFEPSGARTHTSPATDVK